MNHAPQTDKLKLEIHAHCAVVTINNPSANTWDIESLSALRDLVRSLNGDPKIYSIVLTGEGPKFFSAGADLKMFADGDKANAREVASVFGEALETLSNFRGVSIAAINGYAMGGGLEAALACDILIAEEHAQMALPEATVGLLPCGMGTQSLAQLVGEGWAKRLILCGERIKTDVALRICLIQEICETGQGRARALELAEQVAKQSPTSVRVCKELIHKGRHQARFTALPAEREAFVDLFKTKDQAEGVAAFLEKRKPEWSNS